jgi:putative ATP-dependent endonuclease of the OLD family
MNILIDKVRIKNFRALKNIEVSLRPITLLVGANNAGKTTFLKALNSVLGFTRNQINRDDLFVDKNGEESGSKEIIIDVKIIPTDDKGVRISSFDSKWTSKIGGSDLLNENELEFFAFRAIYTFGIEDAPIISYYLFTNWEDGQIQTEEYTKISQIRSNIKMYFIDAQRDILDDSKQRTSFFGKLVSQLDYGDNLETIKKQIEELNINAIDKSDVLKHLKSELSKLNKTTQTKGEGVSINPFPKNIRDLHKGMNVYFQDNGSETFRMDYHGMGTRSWASIISAGAFTSWELQQIENRIEKGIDTDLLFPIFALEEPEAHLHPNAQRTLYKQLKDFKGQKIISTHSPYIAGQAELDELRHFYKEGDVTVVSEIELPLSNEISRKIKNEVIDSKGEILFSRAIVIFEGQTEKLCLPLFASKYFNLSPFEIGLFFTEANGNNYKPFIKLAKMLNIPWFIFSDYDKPAIKKGVENALTEINYSLNDPSQIVKLDACIEEYLINNNYQSEFKNGINAFYLDSCDSNTPPQQIIAGEAKTNNYTDSQLLELLKKDDSKVKFPIYWTKEILKRDNDSNIPPKIRELFDKIAEKINLNPIQYD